MKGRNWWPTVALAVLVIATAFPLYWAVAEGPRPLRHPVVAVTAIAANVAFALTLAKYAP